MNKRAVHLTFGFAFASTLFLAEAANATTILHQRHELRSQASEQGRNFSGQIAQNSSNLCTAALQAAKNRLEQDRDATVAIRNTDISQNYADHPSGRPSEYVFSMRGSATLSILNSPQMMTSISENIITSCKSVSAVEFAQSNTDYYRTFGLFGNTIKEFSCQDFDSAGLRAGRRRPSLAWGEQVCL